MTRYASNNISVFVSKEDTSFKHFHMYEAGLKLPQYARALLAQHYYQRVHLRELGLRLLATCDTHILKQIFGSAADTLQEQIAPFLVSSD